MCVRGRNPLCSLILLPVPLLCRHPGMLTQTYMECQTVEDSGVKSCYFTTPCYCSCLRFDCSSITRGMRNLFHNTQPLHMWSIHDRSVLKQNMGLWHVSVHHVNETSAVQKSLTIIDITVPMRFGKLVSTVY